MKMKRILNESDFPFTVDEVLKQIEAARKEAIRTYKTHAKDFDQWVVKGGQADSGLMYVLSNCAAKVVILNDAHKSFEKLEGESDPEVFEEKLETVRDELSQWDSPHDEHLRRAFRELKGDLSFFKYL